MQMILMTALQSATISDLNSGIYQVAPRSITGGLNIGLLALRADLKVDDRYIAFRPFMNTLAVLDLDLTISFG